MLRDYDHDSVGSYRSKSLRVILQGPMRDKRLTAFHFHFMPICLTKADWAPNRSLNASGSGCVLIMSIHQWLRWSHDHDALLLQCCCCCCCCLFVMLPMGMAIAMENLLAKFCSSNLKQSSFQAARRSWCKCPPFIRQAQAGIAGKLFSSGITEESMSRHEKMLWVDLLHAQGPPPPSPPPPHSSLVHWRGEGKGSKGGVRCCGWSMYTIRIRASDCLQEQTRTFDLVRPGIPSLIQQNHTLNFHRGWTELQRTSHTIKSTLCSAGRG